MSKVTAMANDEWKWKVEAAVNTLIEAEKIKKDKKLLVAARAELKNRLVATQSAMKKM